MTLPRAATALLVAALLAPRPAHACGPEKEPPRIDPALAAAAGVGAPGIAPPPFEHPEVTALFSDLDGWFPATRSWFPMVADLALHPVPGGLAPDWSSLSHPKVVRADGAGQRLAPVAPLRADEPFRVGLEGRPGVWIEITPLDLPRVEAHVSRGLVLFPGAVAGGDLLYKLTPTHVDEYVHLREETPALELRYAFATGPDVSGLRNTIRGVELLDTDGATRLRMSRPFARAVDGTRRDGTLALEDGLLVLRVDLAGLAFPVLVDPDFSAAGDLSAERFLNHAVPLADGSVLYPGGCRYARCPVGLDHPSCSTEVADVDRYDPASGTFAAAAPMAAPRYAYAASLLPGGDVLVAGGCSIAFCSAVTAAAERYDPTADAWTPAGDLSVPRAYATAARLPDGRVIVIGGCDASGCVATTDLYDPLAGTWAPGPPLTDGRGMHTLTELADGRLLVAGGCGDLFCSELLSTAEVLDPAATAWTPAGLLAYARAAHASTRLCDGSVLVTGGCIAENCLEATAINERWVEDTGAGSAGFVPATWMAVSRHHHTATLLGDDTVLVAGGCFQNELCTETAERFDPATGTWTGVDGMLWTRGYHTATLLDDGRVVMAGGCNEFTCIKAVDQYIGPGTGVVDGLDGGVGGSCSIPGDAGVPFDEAGVPGFDGGYRPPPIMRPEGCHCATVAPRPGGAGAAPLLVLFAASLSAGALRYRRSPFLPKG